MQRFLLLGGVFMFSSFPQQSKKLRGDPDSLLSGSLWMVSWWTQPTVLEYSDLISTLHMDGIFILSGKTYFPPSQSTLEMLWTSRKRRFTTWCPWTHLLSSRMLIPEFTVTLWSCCSKQNKVLLLVLAPSRCLCVFSSFFYSAGESFTLTGMKDWMNLSSRQKVWLTINWSANRVQVCDCVLHNKPRLVLQREMMITNDDINER